MKKLMAISGNSGFAVIAALVTLLAFLVQAQDQSGFISLDCGLPEATPSYIEPQTKLRFMSDGPYINTGVGQKISGKYKEDYLQQMWNVRSFPQGTKNCYTIRIQNGTRYLIKTSFLYGNYDGLETLPEFNLYMGANLWNTVSFTSVSDDTIKEIIHVPLTNEIHICLINTGKGTPFISIIEIRPLPEETYRTSSGTSLSLFTRVNLGSTTDTTYRYPDDIYDRFWSTYTDSEWTQVNTSDTIDPNYYRPAAPVMSTAATPRNPNKSLDIISWDSDSTTTGYYIYLHFAEVVKLEEGEFRGFNINLNGEYWYGPEIPSYLTTETIYPTKADSGSMTYNLSLVKIENSTLPPIMNAYEIYTVIDLEHNSETDQGDVVAIKNIKSSYGVSKDWEGDPCTPKGYAWDSLNCTYDGTPRITTLNLSNSDLNGRIPPSIANLAMLQVLDLSNNHLTGAVPSFLSNLTELKVLNLDNNKLNGSIPSDLVNKATDDRLVISAKDNPNLDTCALVPCTNKSSTKKKTSVAIPIAAAVGGLFVIFIIGGAVFWSIRKRKNGPTSDYKSASMSLVDRNTVESNGTSPFDGRMDTKGRQFTYFEVQKITDNFQRVIGKGGFGEVYHGFIDHTQVAVKMLSPSTSQGFQQFQSEVQILMRVHHRSVTRLVGYLNEGAQIGLIYEYMAGGNLHEHLSERSKKVLSLEERLRVAIDAAQGLEYLHHGSVPPIVHRDVKTTNILLTENFQAKLSDFGLSKSFATDGTSHVSTIVAGTPGYLDPDYDNSNRLTEKSDVYSFGVALLEIISCQPVISKGHERKHISTWVSYMVARGDIRGVVDQRLRGSFNVNAVWKAVEIAMACVSANPSKRPSMIQVVVELNDCLETELARTREGFPIETTDVIDVLSPSMTSQLGPMAR